MRPIIEIRYPDGLSEELELNRERTVIGRSATAHIRINDSRVSREHCVLEVDGERVYIVDLGGGNGTWVGATKILPNMREPFPQDLVVHVGPAQLRNVTARLDPGNDLESRAFMPAAPRRQASDDGRAAPAAQSAATIELPETRLKLAPGERGALLLNISNQSKIVDHYTLSISGVPPTWVTLPRGGLELLPRQSGSLNVDFHPPRNARTSAGIHPLSIALLNRQGEIVAQTTADLEIAPFDNLVLDVRPNPYESRSGGELTLTVENNGNAQTEYRVTVLEGSNALEIVVDPPLAQVAPQQSRQSTIRLRPRQRLWIGQPRRMPMTVTVTSNLQSVTAMPVYTQLALIPYWVPILLILACCVLVPLFSLMAVPPAMSEMERRQATAEATRVLPLTEVAQTLTAQPTFTPTPDLAATATAAYWDQDCYGLTYREKYEAGLIICEPDSDRDGLDDYDELRIWRTDPLNRDTSGDGLLDGDVVRFILEGEPPDWYTCLNPNIRDANNDGIPNGVHIAQGTNPCAGAPPTPTPPPTPVRGFALGGHVNNRTDNLAVLSDAGMTWVKVQLRYSPGADVQSTVRDYQEYKSKNFNLLVSVVGHKEDILNGGTGYMQEFGRFLGQLASVADAIEVWNEPNIKDEWPEGQIDPRQYTQLLEYAYREIKAQYPTTIVISAAPAPTGFFGGRCTPEGCDDSVFVAGMAAAGAAQFMDCVGVHFNAGATPPGETSGHPADNGSGHYSWYFLPMLELYWNTFNPPGRSKTVDLCFTEVGFVTDEGLSQTLLQAGAHNFAWGANISLYHQGIWLSDALQRACHSGMVKLFIVWNVDFETYGRDPQAGYAILRPDGKCPSCAHLKDAVFLLRQQNCMA